jgi:hypothetical protein
VTYHQGNNAISRIGTVDRLRSRNRELPVAESLSCIPLAGNVKIHAGPSPTIMVRPIRIVQPEDIKPRMNAGKRGSEKQGPIHSLKLFSLPDRCRLSPLPHLCLSGAPGKVSLILLVERY